MPRASKSGIRGLYADSNGRRRIDLRYTDSAGKSQRYKEVLPQGTPKRAADKHAQQVLAEAITGTLKMRDEPGGTTLASAFEQYLGWVKINRPKSHRARQSIVACWTESVGNRRLMNSARDCSKDTRRLVLARTLRPRQSTEA